MTARTRERAPPATRPSPTGDPHVGNIRTALLGVAVRAAHGGQFLLRLEDTDQARGYPGLA